MFPVVRPKKFIFEIEEILNELSSEVNSENIKKSLPRLHKDNIFNKRFSGVLDTFSDVKSVAERMDENIEESIKIEREIQKRKEINQNLYKEADKLTSQNKTDLKTLYVNSKIFLDEYTNLMRFIFGWRNIGDRSVTAFYNSLDKYVEQDESVISFKDKCFKKLKAVNVYITEYRDDEIVHNQKKHKQKTQWFLNDMNGEVRFIGGDRPSITPQEILFITLEYIDCSTTFCLEQIQPK